MLPAVCELYFHLFLFFLIYSLQLYYYYYTQNCHPFLFFIYSSFTISHTHSNIHTHTHTDFRPFLLHLLSSHLTFSNTLNSFVNSFTHQCQFYPLHIFLCTYTYFFFYILHNKDLESVFIVVSNLNTFHLWFSYLFSFAFVYYSWNKFHRNFFYLLFERYHIKVN